MITDPTLQAVAVATDTSVLVELYHQDAVPTVDGFDPADALKLYASIDGITFAGQTYTRLVKSIGRTRRTTTEEANSVQVTFDNLTREISEFEFATGFEGLILIVRLISRSLSTAIDESIIRFSGRCDKPTSGTKASLSVTAKGILHTTDAEIPRRKFTATDAEGRTPDNPLFEGFPYMPQSNAGSTTYTARVKRGGLLGFLGFKKTVTKTLSYSSFSDMDAEKSLPVAFGRVQVAGTHLAYADIGTKIRMTTAMLEGEISSYATYRTDDIRFGLDVASIVGRYGKLGGVGSQIPHANSAWIGNGYYSRTALVFSECFGTNIASVDPAPLVIVVALATLVTVPDSSGDWTVDSTWDDNAASHSRHIFTSSDYFDLDENWLDDETFTEVHRFNNGIIFDKSYSDILFVPNTPSFTGGETETGRYLLSTGACTPDYFKFLNGDKTDAETFLQTPHAEQYDTKMPGGYGRPGDPIDPDDIPGGSTTPNLSFFLRRRYTSNIVVTETMKIIDFIHKVLFVSSRMFLTQGPNGKLKLKSKKPVDNAIATAAITSTTASIDDVSPWIGDLHGFALLDPNTSNSELRTVTAAVYSTSQNSVTLARTNSGSTTMTVSGATLSGCDGASTPATGTITVTGVGNGNIGTVTLDGVAITFRPNANDTTHTAAGFIYGTINGHPILNRKYVASWTPGTAVVTITGKAGTLTFAAVEQTHSAPLPNPTTAPTLTETASGNLAAGFYIVGYTDVNDRGQTLLAAVTDITVVAGKKITVSSLPLASGATSRNWFCSPTANSYKLRLVANRTVATSFVIDKADLPLLTAPLTPDVNRTGCEIIRVEAAFTDRALTRSAATRSNVLKASYKWKLGNREKSINRIDLKFRDATQDFRLVELRLRDDAHIAKIKKVNKFEVNGQAIDNYHQAYRIASGMLAELRDADFFYEWSSDKAALLLEEGDVVAITDDGAQVFNLPVRIESIEDNEDGGLITCSFTARLYSTTLYDDSVAERQIPIIVETDQGIDYV